MFKTIYGATGSVRLGAIILTAMLTSACEPAEQIEQSGPESLLYVWMFDEGAEAPDFLAVINADASSEAYGEVLNTVPADGIRGHAHHTNITLPSSGMLFANDHMGNYTYIFDTNDPGHPVLHGSFGNIAGYSFPHSFSELPNGNVLATFQTKGDGNETAGGLLELTTSGELVQAGDADPANSDIFIRPYGIVLLPHFDRVITTNFDMRGADLGQHIQVWRLSDLKLLHTVRVPAAERNVEINPFEARLLADGKTVMFQTLSCGLYTVSGIEDDEPQVQFVRSFEGEFCGLPIREGKYWVQTVESETAGMPNRMIVLDISDPLNPVEVDRVTFPDGMGPHWVSPDQSGGRIVVTGYGAEMNRRVIVLNFDVETGSLEIDPNFGDGDEAGPGVIIDRVSWPHGDVGPATAHGAVFWPPVDPDWKN